VKIYTFQHTGVLGAKFSFVARAEQEKVLPGASSTDMYGSLSPGYPFGLDSSAFFLQNLCNHILAFHK
jgi:hypothetical protein